MGNRFVIILLLKTASRPGNALVSTVAVGWDPGGSPAPRGGPRRPLHQDGLSPPGFLGMFRVTGGRQRSLHGVPRPGMRGGGRAEGSGWCGQRGPRPCHSRAPASQSRPPSPSPSGSPASGTRPARRERGLRPLSAARLLRAPPPHQASQERAAAFLERWRHPGRGQRSWEDEPSRASSGSQKAPENRQEPRATPLTATWPVRLHGRRLPILFPTGEPPNPVPSHGSSSGVPLHAGPLGPSDPRPRASLAGPAAHGLRGNRSKHKARPGPQSRRDPVRDLPGCGLGRPGRALWRVPPETQRLLTPGLVRAPAAGCGGNEVARALPSVSTGCDAGQGRGEGTGARQPPSLGARL